MQSSHGVIAACRAQCSPSQRIDVRCASLDSICTQAVLVMGFALVLLAPDVLDILRGDEDGDEAWYDVLFASACVVCTAISFGASTFAIYVSLYVGYKAQFAALQGKTSRAVTTSLDLVLLANEQAIRAFTVSLAALALTAALMAFAHTHLIVFAALLLTLGAFAWQTVRFRRQLDRGFESIGEKCTGMGFGEEFLGQQFIDGCDDGAPSGLPSMLTSPLSGLSADQHRRGSIGCRFGRSAELGGSSVEEDAQHGKGWLRGVLTIPGKGVARSACAASGRAYKTLREQPSVDDIERVSAPFPIIRKGWLRKSPSRLGPTASSRSMDPASAKHAAQDKRFFVLQGPYLKWYSSEVSSHLKQSNSTSTPLLRACRCTVMPASGGTDCSRLHGRAHPCASGTRAHSWLY